MLMILYSFDEARCVVVRSALALLDQVDTPELRLTRLLTGKGSRKSLLPHERSVVYVHWALLADVESLGYGDGVSDELEGILSCIEAEGVAGAAATIATQLPAATDHDSSELAA